MKRLHYIPVSIMIAVLLYLAYIVLWPQKYPVPTERVQASFKRWKLDTGSDIAYLLLPGNAAREKNKTIIYLHGGPGAGITSREIDTWQQVADSGYNVYLYNQVGCGPSGRLKDIKEYTADRHKKDLIEIIKITGNEPVSLAAQSWGSILAVSLMAEHPNLISKLIITAPAPLQPANKVMEQVAPPDSLKLNKPVFNYLRDKQRHPALRMRINNYLIKKFGMKMVRDEEADQFAAWQTDELNRWMVCDTAKAVRAESSEGYYVNMMTSISISRMKDNRAKLSTMQTPILIMKAQCDNQPWGYTAEYLQLFKHIKLVLIENAGHNAYLENEKKYVGEIVKFMDSAAPRSKVKI